MTTPYAVVISARAEAAFRRADAWWREHRPAARDLLVEEFEAAVTQIALSPHSGAAFDSKRVAGVRRWLLVGTRYHVYYTVDDTSHTVTVRTLWHAMRGRAPRL